MYKYKIEKKANNNINLFNLCPCFKNSSLFSPFLLTFCIRLRLFEINLLSLVVVMFKDYNFKVYIDIWIVWIVVVVVVCLLKEEQQQNKNVS